MIHKTHRKIYNLTLAAFIIGGALVIGSASLPAGGLDCHRKEFQTTMYKHACAKGGQREAKKAARKFLKRARKIDRSIRNCKSCHSTLKPRYGLKADGLEKFQSVLEKIESR